MYEKSLNLLKTKEIEFEAGLTSDEMEQIEKIYQIAFPAGLREFLMEMLPISKGFYNWRNIQYNNVQFIKNVINKPLADIYHMAGEVYWCDDWGEEPADERIFIEEVRGRLKEAPKLLPIYAHRYMPMVSEENLPIISVHGMDIVYYGENLEDYFDIEFGNKTQDTIEFRNMKHIQFWSDLI